MLKQTFAFNRGMWWRQLLLDTNPTLLVEEEGHYGTIEIGDQQNEFEKIVSLAHEVGHSILHANMDNFGNYEEVIFKESIAWFLGYDYLMEQGWLINLTEYKDRVSVALDKYVQSLNDKNFRNAKTLPSYYRGGLL